VSDLPDISHPVWPNSDTSVQSTNRSGKAY